MKFHVGQKVWVTSKVPFQGPHKVVVGERYAGVVTALRVSLTYRYEVQIVGLQSSRPDGAWFCQEQVLSPRDDKDDSRDAVSWASCVWKPKALRVA